MLGSDILFRAVFALGLITGGYGLYQLYNRTLRLRTPNLLAELGLVHADSLVLVYFTTPTCVPCKTVQRPAIEKVSRLLGKQLQILEIDATQQPELASRWGVLSVPTTYIIDAHGIVRHINHGVTRAEKLLEQLSGA